MKVHCVRACFWGLTASTHRLWSPGESLELPAGVKVPEHFTERAPEAKPAAPKEPKTLSEMTPSGPVETGAEGPTPLSRVGKPKPKT